jgi:hypothetical protein
MPQTLIHSILCLTNKSANRTRILVSIGGSNYQCEDVNKRGKKLALVLSVMQRSILTTGTEPKDDVFAKATWKKRWLGCKDSKAIVSLARTFDWQLTSRDIESSLCEQ